jgi:BMFP domain-containing protein YqiC
MLHLIRSGERTNAVREIFQLHRNETDCSCAWKRNLPLVFWPDLGYHVVMNNESADNIARRLAEALPEGLRSMRDDLEQNFRSVLRSSLNRLDLVTREEFEVQEAVLARTRAKLEALEARVQEMEKP